MCSIPALTYQLKCLHSVPRHKGSEDKGLWRTRKRRVGDIWGNIADDYHTCWVPDPGKKRRMRGGRGHPGTHPSQSKVINPPLLVVGVGRSRWEIRHCLTWVKSPHDTETFFLQNTVLAVVVVNWLRKGGDKQIMHSPEGQEGPLLFKRNHWMKTVGHAVILVNESYKWQFNEKWNQTSA